MKDNSLMHLGLIPDGNGRWAMLQGRPRHHGHTEGYRAMTRIVMACHRLEIPHVTVFALSKDNLKRQEKELSNLFDIFCRFFTQDMFRFHALNIVINPIGDFTSTNHQGVIESVKYARDLTYHNKGMVLNIATAFSGLDDITNSVLSLYEESDGTIPKDKDKLIRSLMIHSGLNRSPAVDLCVRTGGEQRISSFCLMQLAYSELMFTDILWPDFTTRDLERYIAAFYQRSRRFGLEASE